jgi:hypothetical protein
VSSFVASVWGWHAIYGLSAGLMAALAALLLFILPRRQPDASLHYGQLLASLSQLYPALLAGDDVGAQIHVSRLDAVADQRRRDREAHHRLADIVRGIGFDLLARLGDFGLGRTRADDVLGVLLVFGSAVSYAVYLVFSGAEVKRLGALRLTGLASSVACVLCIVQYLVLRPPLAALALPAPVWWLSLLNATVCTVAPVLLVMLAIERVGATVTAQAGMIGPLSTIAMGALHLGEPFTPWVAAGTALVLSGIWLLARTRT